MAATAMTNKSVQFTQPLVAQQSGLWLPHNPYSSVSSQTLVGSGFGTRGLSLERYSAEDLSSLTAGQQVPGSGLNGWEGYDGSDTTGPVFMSSNGARIPGELVVYGETGPNTPIPHNIYNAALSLDYGMAVPPQTKILTSYYVKAKLKLGGTNGQWKMQRSHVGKDVADARGRANVYAWNTGCQGSIQYDDASYYTLWGGYGGVNPAYDDQWRRLDTFIKTSNYSAYDGVFQCVSYHPTGLVVPAQLFTSISIDPTATLPNGILTYSAAADHHTHLVLQNYFGNGDIGPFGGEVWMCDIVVQIGSWKRLELCNSANYATATIRERQRVVSWTDTLIGYVLDAKSLTGTGLNYLFAVDNNDNMTPILFNAGEELIV